MLRTLWGDDDRYRQVYWSRFPGMYFAGDGAKRDMEGYYWLLGRVDDIILCAGHNISTAEVESALVDQGDVAEAAVVGRTHEIKGQAIAAFVTLRHGVPASDAKREEIREHVVRKIGPIGRPEEIHFAAELPKTRSGKIMRRVFKAVILDRDPGDITTIEDEGSVDEARRAWAEMGEELAGGHAGDRA